MNSIDKKQLRIISLEFRTVASRMMNCNCSTGMSTLKKFLTYIDNTEVISDYIKGYVDSNDFKPVEPGTIFKSMGDTEQQEISRTYQYLKYALENFDDFGSDIVSWYARNINDSVKEFCDRIILPFVNYIDNYLKKLSIQMGIDEDMKYNVTVSGGIAQVNLAGNDAIINATQNMKIDITKLEQLLSDLTAHTPKNLTKEQQRQFDDSINALRTEVHNQKPDKGILRLALTVLRGLNGTAQFLASLSALATFLGVTL